MGVHRLFLRSPVVAVPPVRDELPEVFSVRAIAPVIVPEFGRPADVRESPLQVVEALFGNLDREGTGCGALMRIPLVTRWNRVRDRPRSTRRGARAGGFPCRAVALADTAAWLVAGDKRQMLSQLQQMQ